MGDGNQTGSCLLKEKSFYGYFSTSQELGSYLSAKLLNTDAVTLSGLTQGTVGAREPRRYTQTPNRGARDSPQRWAQRCGTEWEDEKSTE